jgi:hypothetical protein
MCIHVSGQRNHLSCKMNTQMHHSRVKPLQCNVLLFFAYLCIRVSVQRNHSLNDKAFQAFFFLIFTRELYLVADSTQISNLPEI